VNFDDSKLDDFRRDMQEKLTALQNQLGQQETDIGRLWNQLNGLRDTLENMELRRR
jgi:septal ring factor EnvC (AmiA/AmiB activator)